MPYKDVTPPQGGKISITSGKLNVPENPVLPFIRGDGTGPDIWAASERVFAAAVNNAYGGKREKGWVEGLPGGAAQKKVGKLVPDDTNATVRENLVGLHGPVT